MKKIVFSLIILAILSCNGSDDNPPPTSNNVLVGTWNVIKIIYDNTTTGVIEPDVTGTITFNTDGTGRENYTYTVLGIPIPNVSNFTWRSTNTQIIFDEGTSDEAVWGRVQNTSNLQVGRFEESTGNTNITITIEK